MSKRKATVSLAIRPATKKARVRKSAISAPAGDLYAQVFGGENNLDDVVAEWVSSFHNHEARAVAQIVNFVLRCSGCSIQIDENDIGDPDNCPSRLADIQEEYQAQDISEYPLIAKKGAAAFKQALHGFFVSFVKSIAANGLLYENTELLENVQVWISTMSSASNRPFRHTSTVVSLAIISALCMVAGEIVENTAKKNRQSETESKKSRVNKARVSLVNKEIEELNQKLQVVDGSIIDWFDTVYVHRYRDVDPKIRVECVEALADWIVTYPDRFFDGSHLRYLGWVLSDPHPPTRVEVLKQLQRLFRDRDKLAGLKTFTERFRPRVVEIATHDAETHVRAAAVQLLDTLREAGFLEPDDVDSVGRLVYDAEPKVRKAVVGFFAETINSVYEQKIEDMGGQEAVDEALEQDDEDEAQPDSRLEWLKLKCLVEQLVAYDSEDSELPSQIERRGPSGTELGLVIAGVESRFFLAAQALYDAIPEVRSWEALAQYLLHDHSQTVENEAGEDVVGMLQENCKLDDREEIVLLDVLTASVKLGLQRLTEAKKDKKKNKAEKLALKEEEAETVKKLSNIIPQLLKKFGAAPEAASLCLRLERQLNLDIFQELRQNAALTALLDDVNKQFLTHHHENVLDEAIESILHALTHEDSKEMAESKVKDLWDDLVNSFDLLRKDRDLSERGNLETDVIIDLSNNVLKISKLARISEPVVLDRTTSGASGRSKQKKAANANTTPPVTCLLEILNRGVPTQGLDAELDAAEDALVRHTMNTLLLYFVWKCRHCADNIQSGSAIPDDELEAIAIRRDECITALATIMKSRKGADDIRMDAAYLLLDVSNLFFSLRKAKATQGEAAKNQTNGDANDDWQALCQQIDPPTTRMLLQILGAAENNLAKRTGKRVEEPDVEDDPIDVDDAPESSDDEEETQQTQTQTQGTQSADAEKAAEDRKVRALLAEGRLCFLGSRMVHGVQVGALGDEVRRRLERNKTKLGHNWKEVVTHLGTAENLKLPRPQRAKAKKARARTVTPVQVGSSDEIEESGAEE
ncbi:STAG-domain-containing protein [Westerdykella ornata]|uniref:STAG-domain-containing protein n=1 Tax=Westerdykella ornata TaxID=318751 RepID=A0A6A6JAZ0_WESOR|nr:STAG-domain-containing protein [Westerdykella ornata]KAF2273148.1 STAG-domain-containing protein [Westerdykella ornata]